MFNHIVSVTFYRLLTFLWALCSKSAQGETQQILDQLSDAIMTKRLLHSGSISMIVSEEDEHVIYPVRSSKCATYSFCIHPLANSENDIDAGSLVLNIAGSDV